jgi:hypothetical protein
LCVWNAATGKQIGPTIKEDAGLQRALLTTDATRILSWSGKSLRLWGCRERPTGRA